MKRVKVGQDAVVIQTPGLTRLRQFAAILLPGERVATNSTKTDRETKMVQIKRGSSQIQIGLPKTQKIVREPPIRRTNEIPIQMRGGINQTTGGLSKLSNKRQSGITIYVTRDNLTACAPGEAGGISKAALELSHGLVPGRIQLTRTNHKSKILGNRSKSKGTNTGPSVTYNLFHTIVLGIPQRDHYTLDYIDFQVGGKTYDIHEIH